jgi:hypothetical protein
LSNCPGERLLRVNTKDGRAELASQAEKGPSRPADFLIEFVPIETLD